VRGAKNVADVEILLGGGGGNASGWRGLAGAETDESRR